MNTASIRPHLPKIPSGTVTIRQGGEVLKGALDPDQPSEFEVRFTPSRPCTGLTVRLMIIDAEGNERTRRIRSSREKGEGLLRLGEQTVTFGLYNLRLPPGSYTLRLEIKNFRATLLVCEPGQFEVGGNHPVWQTADDGTPRPISVKYQVNIEPEPPETVPRPVRVPWNRQSKPVWSYDYPRRKIHGGYKKRPLSLHIHIPKCGGTTFRREILPQWFPDPDSRAMVKDVFATNYVERDELYCASPTLIERLLLISGHDSYGAVPEPDKGFLPICFFRDPFDRAASLWTHHVVKTPTRFGAALQQHFEDEEAFLTKSDIMLDIWRSFLGFEDMIQFIAMPRSRKPGRELRDVYKGYYKRISETAQARIDALPFVLLTERFDESLVYMHLHHGFPLVTYQRHRVNRPSQTAEQLAERRARLAEVNPVAAAFHEQIVQRFDQQIVETEGFEERLDHYKWLLSKNLPVTAWRARLKRKTGI